MNLNGRMRELAERYLDESVESLEEQERHVLARFYARKPVSRDASDLADEQATFADRLADKVAAVGGSWSFIISFAVVLLAWMLVNTDILSRWGLAFDPYPYIFLNLMLSTLAAIQAPIIMMSQNRQAAKDRLAARLDFEVNLRAELEILNLHSKIDDVIVKHLERLADNQAELGRAVAQTLQGLQAPPK